MIPQPRNHLRNRAISIKERSTDSVRLVSLYRAWVSTKGRVLLILGAISKVRSLIIQPPALQSLEDPNWASYNQGSLSYQPRHRNQTLRLKAPHSLKSKPLSRLRIPFTRTHHLCLLRMPEARHQLLTTSVKGTEIRSHRVGKVPVG